MGRKPRIPRKDAEFDAFFSNYCRVAGQKTSGESPARARIPQGRVTELSGAGTARHEAYSGLLGPHTAAEAPAKNQARKAAEKILEEFNVPAVCDGLAARIRALRSKDQG
jgi:hypothetical protein